ncbi:DNA helicase mcm9 [Anaeramoeba flamelloides]|uniref:DNA helicase n=1 Tax=Anaeramoeba flamelloides TaxID=1746091 RepID=A0ABQ8YD63_9EUKA|nr:DNA helicase mcm9 [Anaeramoeba flamelloides]
MIDLFYESIGFTQKEIISYEEKIVNSFDNSNELLEIKNHVHPRFKCLPEHPYTKRQLLPLTKDIGSFISFSVTVIRTGNIKMLEYESKYQCKYCKSTVTIRSQIENFNEFQSINKCPNPQCKCTYFLKIKEKSLFKDYQEIRVQENFGQLGVRSLPRSMYVTLDNDLTDVCKVGDNIILIGTVMTRYKYLKNNKKVDLQIFIKANSIQVNDSDVANMKVTDELKLNFIKFWEHYQSQPLLGRNLIVSSVAPQLFGLSFVKLTLLLVIIGGVPNYDSNSGYQIRSKSHLLLIGDSGTGKSQLLKYCQKISPRSVLTTGMGSTTAGLTVSFVRDNSREWGLESGALVLANKGVCCIDEFDSIKKQDRSSIHEAMEQQTISIAKAGIVTTLQTNCSIVAAANPKGKYDLNQSISINVTLSSPLLSRFDVILILLDTIDKEWDSKISNFILNKRDLEKKHFSKINKYFSEKCQKTEENDNDQEKENAGSLWNLEKVKSYISFIKDSLNPKISKQAKQIILAYYQKQRKTDLMNVSRTTVRLLESLIRLSQAHARLMFRNIVTIQDAIISIIVIDSSSTTKSLLGFKNHVQSIFHKNPDKEYFEISNKIIEKLDMNELLTETIVLNENNFFNTNDRNIDHSNIKNKLKENFIELQKNTDLDLK